MIWWLVSLLAWPTAAAVTTFNASKRSKPTGTGGHRREIRNISAAMLLLVVLAVHITAISVSVLSAGQGTPILYGALMLAGPAYLYIAETLMLPVEYCTG